MPEARATLRSARRLLRRSWGDALELALPTSCAACGTFLDGLGADAMLCEVCDSDLYEARRAPHCPLCASPLPDALGPCGRCGGKGIRPFDAIARLGTFESTLRSLVHAIKYGRRWPLVPWIGRQMMELPRVTGILDRADVLVPVPLHWSRRIGRGFNQSQLLAKSLERRNLATVFPLRRVRRTPSQTTQPSRAARRRNLIGAFHVVHPELVAGKRVVLVDDVMTSGATLREAARTLLRAARPKTLSALVIATANPLKTDLAAV